MDYVESFDLFGTNVSPIACIRKSGAPTTETKAAVGCLYMNTDNGAVYKCVAEADGVYTWKPLETGGGGGGITDEQFVEMYNNAIDNSLIDAIGQEYLEERLQEYATVADVETIAYDAVESQIDYIADYVIGILPVYDGEVVE